jgi:hypothetical protein
MPHIQVALGTKQLRQRNWISEKRLRQRNSVVQDSCVKCSYSLQMAVERCTIRLHTKMYDDPILKPSIGSGVWTRNSKD